MKFAIKRLHNKQLENDPDSIVVIVKKLRSLKIFIKIKKVKTDTLIVVKNVIKINPLIIIIIS